MVVYLHEESLPHLNLYMFIYVMLIKKTCTSNSFVALPRLHPNAVDCTHDLINGECWIRLGRVAKNGIINKQGVPSIRNSRVYWLRLPAKKHRTDFFYPENWILNSHTVLLLYPIFRMLNKSCFFSVLQKFFGDLEHLYFDSRGVSVIDVAKIGS